MSRLPGNREQARSPVSRLSSGGSSSGQRPSAVQWAANTKVDNSARNPASSQCGNPVVLAIASPTTRDEGRLEVVADCVGPLPKREDADGQQVEHTECPNEIAHAKAERRYGDRQDRAPRHEPSGMADSVAFKVRVEPPRISRSTVIDEAGMPGTAGISRTTRFFVRPTKAPARYPEHAGGTARIAPRHLQLEPCCCFALLPLLLSRSS